MCTILIVPVLPPFRESCRKSYTPVTILTLLGLFMAVVASAGLLTGLFGSVPFGHIFFGMLAVDRFSLVFKIILYIFTFFVVLMWFAITKSKTRITDTPDYLSLILGAVLGMSLMASATNLLMIFLAIETASFPSFALAGFYKSTNKGSEASLKYVMLGAVCSAVMLYCLSILYGSYGSLDITNIAQQIAANGATTGLLVGMIGLLIGIGFKLSAVPMHFWCPDVFESAPIEITTFLSVASKGAAIVLLLRIILTIGYFFPETNATLSPHYNVLLMLSTAIGILGLLTATWGNLAAYFQDNIKRMLAYSSIAHAGYMIMAVSLITSSTGGITRHPAGLVHENLAYAILFYLMVYSIMNFGAFTAAALIARSSKTESITEYAGLAARQPVLAILFGCCLMSLFGMPGTGGFWAKVRIGFAMWDQNMWWLVAGLLINTVLSLYLYIKPIAVMIFKKSTVPTSNPQLQPANLPLTGWLLLFIAVLAIFATGLIPDQSSNWALDNATINYRPNPTAPVKNIHSLINLDNTTKNSAVKDTEISNREGGAGQ